MRRMTVLAAMLLFAAPATYAQQNVYSLPRTAISLEVDAEIECFHAGPYAAYAKKYLGIDARTEDASICRITAVRMHSSVEADLSQRFVAPASAVLPLTSQGLVCFASDADRLPESWRFPSAEAADFASRGVSSNFAVEEKKLYKTGEDGETVEVLQSLSVQKTPEKRAAEAAEIIMEMRSTRARIITGDTDMSYNGEAMGAAIQEMRAIEREYLSMFIGYTDRYTQTFRTEVVPDRSAAIQKYVAFRVSETEGLVAADNMTGSPVVLELVPEEISPEPVPSGKASKLPYLKYRIPAVCRARLYDGTQLLLETRVPVFQLGAEATLPLPAPKK